MDPIDLILAKLGIVWNAIEQFFEDPLAMLIFAAIVIITALAFLSHRH